MRRTLCLLAAIAGIYTAATGASFAAGSLDPQLSALLHRLSATTTSSTRARSLRSLGAVLSRSGSVPVLVRLRGDAVPEGLTGLGAKVLTRAGHILSVEVPASQLQALASLPGVAYVQGVRKAKPRLDVSVPGIGGTIAHTELGRLGTGALVGIIDAGVDLRHPDLRTADGKTRVLRVWDMTDNKGPRPAGYGFGTEYTDADINASLAAGQVPGERDDDPSTEGHGTHVSGIAAGNGRSASQFTGVAPAADLIEVKFDYTHALEAHQYILDQAAKLGRPVSINNSWGTHYGPHDGTDTFSQAMDGLFGPGKPGRAVSFSAGNEADAALHTSGVLPVGKSVTAVIGTSAGANLFEVDAYYDAGDKVTCELVYASNSTGSTQSFSIATGQQRTFHITSATAASSPFVGADVFMDSSESPYPNNPSLNHLYLSVDLTGTRYGTIDRTPWSLRLTRTAGTGTGSIHMWLPTEAGESFAMDTGDLRGDGDYSIVDEATGHNVIAVGSYVTKTSWTGLNGHKMSFAEPGVLSGDPSTFTSHGPTRDGRRKPDISAPGEWIASALTEDLPTAIQSWPSYITSDKMHQLLEGTSMASPHVAGSVALLFEENPSLDSSQVLGALQRTARVTSRDAAWGYRLGPGRLDIGSALRDPVASHQGVIGDLNGDGILTVQDAIMALKSVAGLQTLTPAQQSLADVAPKPGPARAVGDNAVTIQDVIRLLKRVAGLEPDPWP
ncbi:MAG TPA: S8 family serine peptidase [Armatimonadota bacterium]|jgi:subtilisin family serine protease